MNSILFLKMRLNNLIFAKIDVLQKTYWKDYTVIKSHINVVRSYFSGIVEYYGLDEETNKDIYEQLFSGQEFSDLFSTYDKLEYKKC